MRADILPMSAWRLSLFAVLSAWLAGCTTVADTNPPRTATEELLISTAADRAAAALLIQVPRNMPVFIDGSTFDGTDSKYAIGALRASLLRQGVRLVDDKKDAKIVAQLRAGALSTNHKSMVIGVPSFSIPIPFTSTPLTIPEIAFYGDEAQKGIAKFAVALYDAKTGKLIDEPDPQFGFAHSDKQTVAIFISWRSDDIFPEEGDIMNNEGQDIKIQDR
jgi:hypothetical protein